jgi:4'-phosphopantetheinyl transferase EntD
VIEALLPAGVVAAEAFEDPPDATLFPEEEALVRDAVVKRRREFTTARHCARTALAGLGIPPVPVLAGSRREPLWPHGVVGSITHCLGYRAAAVGFADAVVTIGIDAEPNEPLPPGVLDSIARPEELSWVAHRQRTQPAVCWDRLLFSAKESVYKAWYPLARRWLDFEEATVAVVPADGSGATGSFTARLEVPGPVLPGAGRLTHFVGRWLVCRGLALTAIAVEHEAVGSGQAGSWPA